MVIQMKKKKEKKPPPTPQKNKPASNVCVCLSMNVCLHTYNVCVSVGFFMLHTQKYTHIYEYFPEHMYL